jgi:hypothetical protein
MLFVGGIEGFGFQSTIVVVAPRVIGVTVIMATGYLAADDRASIRVLWKVCHAVDVGDLLYRNSRMKNVSG